MGRVHKSIDPLSIRLNFMTELFNNKTWFFNKYAAAAASLQSCPILCDPIDGSQPGFLSLGFSRQEHWSGLPFPSPMHESEKWKWSRSVLSDSSRPHELQPTRLLCPWDFLGKSTGVGCHFILQGIFLTRGSNLGLLHCRQILYHLSHKGSSGLSRWIPNPMTSIINI